MIRKLPPRCDECGFGYDTDTGQIAPLLAAFPLRYRTALAGVDPARAADRRQPEVWSPLEYACHVRDVLLIQRDRAVLGQVEERPGFARMYRDERVQLCGYDAEDLDTVLGQLDVAAGLCATVFGRIPPGAWARPVIYNFPAPTVQDLAWLGRHTIHEAEHHLMDITRLLTLP